MTAIAASLASGATEQAFILHAAGARWAVPTCRIETIVRVAAITPVPLAPAMIAGLVNLRGRVVVAIDLARRLFATGDLPQTFDQPRLAVVVDHGGAGVALLVDGAGDVVTITDGACVAPPANVPEDIGRLTAAWLNTSVGLVPLLQIDRLVDIECDRRSGNDRRGVHPTSGAKP